MPKSKGHKVHGNGRVSSAVKGNGSRPKPLSCKGRHPKARFAEAVPPFQVTLQDNEDKTTTTVQYKCEVDEGRRENRLEHAREVVLNLIPSDEGKPTAYFIEKGKAMGVSETDISTVLAEMRERSDVDASEVETGKPGRKPIHYRWKPNPDN